MMPRFLLVSRRGAPTKAKAMRLVMTISSTPGGLPRIGVDCGDAAVVVTVGGLGVSVTNVVVELVV